MNITRKSSQKIILLFVLLFAAWGFISNTHAQEPPDPAFRVHCVGAEIQIDVLRWEAGETLTLFINGEESSLVTIEDDGTAHIRGGAEGVTDILLEDSNGNAVVAGSADCSVPTPDIEYLNVNPPNASVFVDTPFTFRAFGVGENDEEIEVNIIWSTDNGTISPGGTLTAAEEGKFVVTASMIGDSYSSTHLLNVTATATPQSIAISPEEVSLNVGGFVFFEVTGVGADGNEFPVTPTLSIDKGEIDPFGFFEPLEVGDFTVTATIEGTDLSATAIVHVLPVVESVEIRPQIEELEVGETQQFEVVGIGEDGEDIPLPAAPVWSAELGGINTSGLYTATVEGTETITVVVPRQAAGFNLNSVGVLAMAKEPFKASLIFNVLMKQVSDNEKEVSVTDQDAPAKEISEDEASSLMDFLYEYWYLVCLFGLIPMVILGVVIILMKRRAEPED